MIDLSECNYVVETYVDLYKTLSQSIMYRYGDNRERAYLRTTINPNLTILLKICYFKENGELIHEKKFN